MLELEAILCLHFFLIQRGLHAPLEMPRVLHIQHTLALGASSSQHQRLEFARCLGIVASWLVALLPLLVEDGQLLLQLPVVLAGLHWLGLLPRHSWLLMVQLSIRVPAGSIFVVV